MSDVRQRTSRPTYCIIETGKGHFPAYRQAGKPLQLPIFRKLRVTEDLTLGEVPVSRGNACSQLPSVPLQGFPVPPPGFDVAAFATGGYRFRSLTRRPLFYHIECMFPSVKGHSFGVFTRSTALSPAFEGVGRKRRSVPAPSEDLRRGLTLCQQAPAFMPGSRWVSATFFHGVSLIADDRSLITVSLSFRSTTSSF